jgi:hypothetical protein
MKADRIGLAHLLNKIDGTVGGTVIDHHDFEGGVTLASQGIEAGPQKFAAVPVGDHHPHNDVRFFGG